MVTKRPTSTLDGYVRLTYGNYDPKIFEGAVGGPLGGDAIMARVAGKIEKRDSYGRNLFTGKDVDDRDAQAVRGSLLVRPSSDFDLLLVGDYFREHDNNYAFHYFGPTTMPEQFLASSLLGGQTIFGYYAARNERPDVRNIYSNEDAINLRRGYGGTAVATWTPGDLSIVSTTAYRDFRRSIATISTCRRSTFGQNNYIEDSKTFSQEFTVNYTADKLILLGGAMYFHEKLFGEVRVPTTNLAAYFNVVLGTNLPRPCSTTAITCNVERC